MDGGRSSRFVLLVTINFLLNSPANAGIFKRSSRMVREVYPPDVEPENDGNQPQVCIVGDVVYGADEPVPAEQPCLKCRCQPPGVQCETVQCAKKPGCKAIHRPNKCCPDYQCECEHNGRIYANGEKLETNPGGECKVCYCRGGEVQCAEVSCYIRNDCEGKRVPGTCCPKYDNCPPIDAVPNRSSIPDLPTNTLKPVILELWQDPNTTEVPSSSTTSAIPEDSNKVPDTSDSVTIAPTFEEIPVKEQSPHPRITIQEIIPEIKEIPITAPPKILISEPQGTLVIEEALPTGENSFNDLNIDSEPESSEVSEVFHHPPPVLRIGDKLLFLNKGNLIPEKDTSTPNSIITIIGAEGLQRGGVEEESLEVLEEKNEPAIEDVGKLSTESTSLGKTSDDVSTTVDTNELELNPEESTHILSLVKRKGKVTTTTTEAPTTQDEEILTTIPGNIEDVENETVDLDVTNITESIGKVNNSEPILVEQNPAYPPIPDMMPAVGDVSQKFEVELGNSNSTATDVKILPDVFELLTNRTILNETQWLKSEEKKNESLIDFRAAILPDELLNERSPIDEVEETTSSTDKTETTEQVETTTVKLVEDNKQLIAQVKLSDGMAIDAKSVESIEVDSLEQTTPKSNHSSLLSDENASLESTQGTKLPESNSEASDMTRISGSIELGSVEISDASPESSILKDVELIPSSTVKAFGEDNVMKQDVELINIPKPTAAKVETSTYELLPTPEEAKSKTVIKRSANEEDVFKDLERELNASESHPLKTPEEEQKEADDIFKELMEETKTTSGVVKPVTKEQEKVTDISNALAGLVLKGQVPDPKVFRLIGGLLGGQREEASN